jgi:hypothetical protein
LGEPSGVKFSDAAKRRIKTLNVKITIADMTKQLGDFIELVNQLHSVSRGPVRTAGTSASSSPLAG